MRKLNHILLVDDDDATLFLHQILFEEVNLVKNISTALNGQKALDYIQSCKTSELPELILLDINMPLMNGFEFLEHYTQFEEERKVSVKLMMLSTSSNPDDIIKAKKSPEVKGFVTKPLTEEKILGIWEKYFKN